jgi:hypothetical protein
MPCAFRIRTRRQRHRVSPLAEATCTQLPVYDSGTAGEFPRSRPIPFPRHSDTTATNRRVGNGKTILRFDWRWFHRSDGWSERVGGFLLNGTREGFWADDEGFTAVGTAGQRATSGDLGQRLSWPPTRLLWMARDGVEVLWKDGAEARLAAPSSLFAGFGKAPTASAEPMPTRRRDKHEEAAVAEVSDIGPSQPLLPGTGLPGHIDAVFGS